MTSPPKKDFLKVKIGRNRSGFSRGIGLTKRIQCEKCDRDFAGRATYRRHVYEQHARKSKLNCSFCAKTFARKHDLDKHIKKNHVGCQSTVPDEDRQMAIKEDPDGSTSSATPTANPQKKRMSVLITPLRPVTAETPASDQPMPSEDASSSQDAAVQTVDAVEGARVRQEGRDPVSVTAANTSSLGSSSLKETGQRVIERTTRELLDEDGRVVARVTTERFLVD